MQTKSGFKKKTAIEFVFSMDQSFSHASALMSEDDKVKAAKLWMDCAETTYKECFSQYLKSYHGVAGETGASLYFHNDNRMQASHDHVHLNVSNLVRLDDGKIMAIEIPEMRQRNFHQSMDAMFKNMFVERWEKEFGKDYPVEAYDTEKQSIKANQKFQTQEIENFRVAFTDDILEKIRLRSKSKELIDKVITQQKRDEYERTELKRMAIQEKIDALDSKIKGIDLPANYGVIKAFSSAPFNNDPKEKDSYFVELELKNGKTKKLWAMDLENAIKSQNLKIGDFAGFSQTGEKAVKVKDKDGKWIDAVKKTWEGFNLSKVTEEMDTLADLDAQMKSVNKAHESSIRVIESIKNRDKVWMTIKEKKKAIGKELKDVELHKEAVQLGDTIKKPHDRGQVFVAQDDYALLDKLTSTNPFFTKFDLTIELSKTGAMGSKAQHLADQKLKEWADAGLLVSKQHKDVQELSGKKTEQKAPKQYGSKKSKSKQSANKKEPEYPIQFTTVKLALQEVENINIAKSLVSKNDSLGVKNYRQIIADAIRSQHKDRRFNGLQVDLIKAVLETNGSRLVLCEGFPGTGKSTVMGTAIEIAQQHAGSKCLVLAPTGKVAASAGADTTANHTGTMDAWLLEMDSGKRKIENNSIIFLDEAGMVGTKNYNKFMNHINKAIKDGVDVRVVLIGDTNQIQSVQAGNTYSNIIKECQNNVKYLRKIIRQKDDISLQVANITSLSTIDAKDMAAVKKSGKHVEESWKLLEKSDRLKEFDTTTEKNEWLTSTYIADKNSFADKVILCVTNEDIKTINELIQEKRLATGEIGGKSIKNYEESFYVGDRVMVNKNAKEYKNGDFGVIKKINDDGSFDVEFGDGKNSKIKTMKDPNRIALANAISIHKSQGLTVNSVLLNPTDTPIADQELWNVAQTRARYITLTAVVKADKQKVLDAFKRENSKVNMLEVGLEHQAKMEQASKQVQVPVVPSSDQVDKQIQATKQATETLKAVAAVPTPDAQAGRPNIMARLKQRFKAFGSISNSVFSPRKPPVAIIKQRQAALAAQQAATQVQNQTQVQKTQQAQIAQQQQAIKKKRKLGLEM